MQRVVEAWQAQATEAQKVRQRVLVTGPTSSILCIQPNARVGGEGGGGECRSFVTLVAQDFDPLPCTLLVICCNRLLYPLQNKSDRENYQLIEEVSLPKPLMGGNRPSPLVKRSRHPHNKVTGYRVAGIWLSQTTRCNLWRREKNPSFSRNPQMT